MESLSSGGDPSVAILPPPSPEKVGGAGGGAGGGAMEYRFNLIQLNFDGFFFHVLRQQLRKINERQLPKEIQSSG